MFILVHCILVLFLFSVQTTWLRHLSLAGVTPDLALIFVVYCGIHFKGARGIWMGFTVGLVQDCLSGGLLGVNTLSKSLVAFFFAMLKDKIIVEGLVPISFFLVGASLFDGAIFYVVLVSLLKGQVSAGFLFPSLFIYGLYNGLAGLFLFYVLDLNRKWILRKFPNQFIRPL